MPEINFDGSEEEITSLPEGEYNAEIVSTEIRTSKKGSNYLVINFRVVDGKYLNLPIAENLNLYHPSPGVRAKAKATLSQICESLGMPPKLQNSDDLHGKILKIVVREAIDPKYGKQSFIECYLPSTASNTGLENELKKVAEDDVPF